MLSVAPLVGTEAYTDATHTRWLHIHVRPNTRGMLKAVKVHTTSSARHISLNVPPILTQ